MEAKIIGHISVDAGIVWIGDPCYILHKDPLPKAIGTDWVNFCNRLGDKDIIQFSHDKGHDGLGVCVSTLDGDGYYPVIGFFEKGNKRPSAIMVDYANVCQQFMDGEL